MENKKFTSDQRQSLHGGGNSPAFSRFDELIAHGMGVSLDPADVVAIGCGKPQWANTSLQAIRTQIKARSEAEKKLADARQEIDDLLAWVAAIQIDSSHFERRIAAWRRLAMVSVPVVALEAAVILWLSYMTIQ